MKVKLCSIPVTDRDQAKALKFYTEVLGFEKRKDEQLPNNMGWWLTVGTPEEPNGAELLLEPARGWEPAKVYYEALYNSGIPVTALKSDDLRKEYEELKNKGVVFRGEPAEFAGSLSVMFDDTCGNLLQLYQVL